MRAFWMEPGEAACSQEELLGEGIGYEAFDPRQVAEASGLQKARRALAMDEAVELSAMQPRLESVIAKEADEHAHMADEVRLFVRGDGVYDVRARDERWMRVFVGAGDLVVIPARRYHRFLLGQQASVGYVAVFADRTALLPLFRVSDDETRAV